MFHHACLTAVRLFATVTLLAVISSAMAQDYRFFVSDKSNKKVFRYTSSYVAAGSFDTSAANSNPEDCYVARNYVYVVDQGNKQLYRYNFDGTGVTASRVLVQTNGTAMAVPKGMTVAGDVLYVVDDTRRLMRFSLAAAFTGTGNLSAIEQVTLPSSNDKPYGLTADATYVYVVNESSGPIYRYLRSPLGTSQTASKTLRTPGGVSLSKLEGIALADGGATMYVVSLDPARAILPFNAASLFPAPGTLNAISSNNVASGNTEPLGIGVNQASEVLSIVRTADNPTSASAVEFLVTFSDAVTGVDASDFTLAATGAIHGTSILGVSGSGTTYTVEADTGTSDGQLRLDFVNGDNSVINWALQPVPAYSDGDSYDIDKTPPVVQAFVAESFTTFTVTFDDPYGMGYGVLDPANYELSGAGQGGLSATPDLVTHVSGNTYRLEWLSGTSANTQTATITVSPPVCDLAGNPIVVGSGDSADTVTVPVGLSGFSLD